MSSGEEGYIIIRNPNNPNQTVRAKLLNYEKTRGENFEYRLEDGTRIRLDLQLEHISRVIDPTTNIPAINPQTREPIINVSWSMRVTTIYSERALNESRDI